MPLGVQDTMQGVVRHSSNIFLLTLLGARAARRRLSTPKFSPAWSISRVPKEVITHPSACFIFGFPCHRQEESGVLLDAASWTSLLLFSWLNPLFKTGAVRQLRSDDLPDLARKDRTVVWADRWVGAHCVLQADREKGPLLVGSLR